MPAIPLHAPRRLLATTWLAMVLLVASVSALAVWQTQRIETRFSQLQAQTLPVVDLVRELRRQAEEQRGLAALHLMRGDESETSRLEDRIQAQRQQLTEALVIYEGRALDEADRRLHQQARQRFAAYWQAQDKVLALSRRALDDPRAAQAARQVMSGDAQQAFTALRQVLESWASHVEARAAQALAEARSDAQQARWLIAAGALVAALLGAALARWALASWPAVPAWAEQSTSFADTEPLRAPSEIMAEAVAQARAGPWPAGSQAQPERHPEQTH